MLKEIDAGVTMVHIETGYGKKQQQGVLCVIPKRKLYSVKELVQMVDPKAFITITQINEVRGKRIYAGETLWRGKLEKK